MSRFCTQKCTSRLVNNDNDYTPVGRNAKDTKKLLEDILNSFPTFSIVLLVNDLIYPTLNGCTNSPFRHTHTQTVY